ncbi:MAG: glycosyltransferase family 39 protein [Pseudomonadota bacterium]
MLPALQVWIGPSYGIDFTDNYQMLGWNLSQGNGYRFSTDTALTMMREPGYPVFLAGLFSVFGYSLAAARMANLAFTFVSALLVSRLTLKLSGCELAARIAPAIFLLHPGMGLAEARGGLECLFIMLLLIFFVLLYRALASRRLVDYLFAGLVLGLSATVRSTAMLFPVFLLAYFAIWERARPSIVAMLSRVAVMIVAAFVMLTPWIVRNYRLVEQFVPTASVAGVSAYAGYHICTNLTFSNTLYEVDDEAGVVRAQIARAAGIKFKETGNVYYLYFYDPHDELKFSRVLGERVVQLYSQSPTLLPICAAKNFFHFWFSGKNWRVTAINFAIQVPYMILAGIGLVAGLRGKQSALFAPLLLFIVYTLCVYLPILAQARYSIHLLPFLSLLAAIPIARWWSRRAQSPDQSLTGSIANV